jgi:deoxyribose-phosphate aldolase
VATIYVPLVFVRLACSLVGKYGIEVGTTAGYPYGNTPTAIKLQEIEYAIQKGAKWVDVGLNLSFVKSVQWLKIENEVLEIVNNTNNRTGLKLIIEAPYLTDRETIDLVEIIDKHGVEFVKSSTGVGTKIALRHVELIKKTLKNAKIKAAGGISSLKQAMEFFDLGADVIESSHGFRILEEAAKDAV